MLLELLIFCLVPMRTLLLKYVWQQWIATYCQIMTEMKIPSQILLLYMVCASTLLSLIPFVMEVINMESKDESFLEFFDPLHPQLYILLKASLPLVHLLIDSGWPLLVLECCNSS